VQADALLADDAVALELQHQECLGRQASEHRVACPRREQSGRKVMPQGLSSPAGDSTFTAPAFVFTISEDGDRGRAEMMRHGRSLAVRAVFGNCRSPALIDVNIAANALPAPETPRHP